MADLVKVELGAVQQTLFIPLAARARETRRRRPVLRDPKAAEILASVDFDNKKYGRSSGGSITVLRTAIFDCWVSDFLAEHPGGTVVEIGTGLNTRFDRVDNGQAHWIDLDLPDTIELRRKFFADSGRRRMVAASVLEEDWLPAVLDTPRPYFFAAEGVLAYAHGGVCGRMLGVFVRVWEYEVPDDQAAAFTAAYAPDGAWGQLFGRAAGFVGTELYRDAARSDRYLTIDRWRDEQDWRSFLRAFGSAYESLDIELEGLAAAERSLFEGSS